MMFVQCELVWSSGTVQDSESEGREFEPRYGQLVMPLGKVFNPNCFVDPSVIWVITRNSVKKAPSYRHCKRQLTDSIGNVINVHAL